eukprot:gene25208-10852_t
MLRRFEFICSTSSATGWTMLAKSCLGWELAKGDVGRGAVQRGFVMSGCGVPSLEGESRRDVCGDGFVATNADGACAPGLGGMSVSGGGGTVPPAPTGRWAHFGDVAGYKFDWPDQEPTVCEPLLMITRGNGCTPQEWLRGGEILVWLLQAAVSQPVLIDGDRNNNGKAIGHHFVRVPYIQQSQGGGWSAGGKRRHRQQTVTSPDGWWRQRARPRVTGTVMKSKAVEDHKAL